MREITLGAHEVPVYAQRHAYLTNSLSKFFRQLTSMGTDLTLDSPEDLVPMLGEQAYDLLAIVLPTYGKRVPRYEFAGYASQEAMDNGDYDEAEDKSPSFPEIMDAFKAAAAENRFDVLSTIAKVVDPKLLKQLISTQIAIAISNASASLPSTSDGSTPSTSSGTTAPTSSENAV